MIRPVRFAANPSTADSNTFQRAALVDAETSQTRALAEFEALRSALERAGVEVVVFDDTPEPHTPDSIFPNNWVSFHADGTAVIYPMHAANRRDERRLGLLDSLANDHGFDLTRLVDLTRYEDRGLFLEGTGSLVLDRTNRVAFACLSARTHREPLTDFCRQLGYEAVVFEAYDGGAPIYHTNVLMWVGQRIAAVCVEAIPCGEEREHLLERLAVGGREVLQFDVTQVRAFAGNMLELVGTHDNPLLVMSERARRVLSKDQATVIEGHSRIVSVPLEHIEDLSGGGVRCMLAAIHLPRSS